MCYLTKLSIAVLLFIFRVDDRLINYWVKSPSATFSTTNPTYIGLGSKRIPRIERPTITRLSRPTATLDSFRKSSLKIRRKTGERFLYCSYLAILFQLQRRVRRNKYEDEQIIIQKKFVFSALLDWSDGWNVPFKTAVTHLICFGFMYKQGRQQPLPLCIPDKILYACLISSKHPACSTLPTLLN